MPTFETNSPLRYPGGKGVLTDFLAATIAANGLEDCTYVEPYAGGAGAAINLLLSGRVKRIILNDADRNVWAFWKSVLDHTDKFLERVEETPLTVEEWSRQRAIYANPKGRTTLERGFAAFFLNRCSRSGIITNGGVIGGLNQTGKWKIGARFYRAELKRRVERIAACREQIMLANLDAVTFLRDYVLIAKDRSRFFVYLDPPYFVKGSRLYLNYYAPGDHAEIARFLRKVKHLKWLVTYDNVPEIRELYDWCTLVDFDLRYSAYQSRQGSEIVIHNEDLMVPEGILPRAEPLPVAS